MAFELTREKQKQKIHPYSIENSQLKSIRIQRVRKKKRKKSKSETKERSKEKTIECSMGLVDGDSTDYDYNQIWSQKI